MWVQPSRKKTAWHLDKMRELSKTLFEQMKQAEELDRAIRQNLEALGYGE